MSIEIGLLDIALAIVGLIPIIGEKTNNAPFFIVAVIYESALILSALALLRAGVFYEH